MNFPLQSLPTWFLCVCCCCCCCVWPTQRPIEVLIAVARLRFGWCLRGLAGRRHRFLVGGLKRISFESDGSSMKTNRGDRDYLVVAPRRVRQNDHHHQHRRHAAPKRPTIALCLPLCVLWSTSGALLKYTFVGCQPVIRSGRPALCVYILIYISKSLAICENRFVAN